MGDKRTDRNNTIDSVGGLLILQMIILHCFQHAGMTKHQLYAITYPLYFFMPWFFYKAGMFYKQRDTKDCIVGGFKKLMIPFIIFSLVGHFVYGLHIYLNCDYNWKHYIFTPMKEILQSGACQGNLPLWFLVSLFFVKIVYNSIKSSKSSIFFNDCVICLIFAGIALLLNYMSLPIPLYVANICSGLAFYSLGHLLREKQYGMIFFIISFVIYSITAFCGWNSIDMRTNLVGHGYYWLWIPTALAGIVLFNNLFKRMGAIHFLSYIGRNAMCFYVMHWIVIQIVKIIFVDIIIMNNPHATLLLILTFESILLPLFVKVFAYGKLRWMIGK